MPSTIQPGLIVLHSNQLEQLRDAVFGWIRRYPLEPLEKDIFLVQSNGIAEWLKIALAEHHGISAANRVELPGRLLWHVYRAMLGRDAIPKSSSLDKSPLTWRLMRLIPELLGDPDFAPLRHFLGNGDAERRLQLVSRLADLIDLYQVYRTDWLQDWAVAQDQLRRANGESVPLAIDQRWQAKLWRAILADLPEQERSLGRVNVHRRFVEAIRDAQQPATPLPRRVILFGMSALPRQTMEALSALSVHTQVILAIPNPCQYFWGDIMEGRELFRTALKRHQQRGSLDLATIPVEQLHVHSHPLLASWGRLGRDFVRLLDEFDQAEMTRSAYPQLKIDLFSEDEGDSLLEQVQVAIRDLTPLGDHPGREVAANDRSIEFHVTHSTQREVEVLHDRLLSLFEKDSGSQIRPRDVIVMVPDIANFSASIRAVFEQYKRSDSRYIPYEIGDLSERNSHPLVVALDWLLRLPQQRCEQTEVLDLLDVPAIAARFSLEAEDLPRLKQWIEGAGIRWGLDLKHRASLGLIAAGEQNTWLFGIRRMLLGYACGAEWQSYGIASYGEIGGLESALAGSLAEFLEALMRWNERLAQCWTPGEWALHARELLEAFFLARSEDERLILARLNESLAKWLLACEDAAFHESVPLAVFREPWLNAMDEANLGQRFISGGVSFCSFMPMRSMPYQMVCLLGMNEGEFPRSVNQMDFDLLNLPGMSRPGDRSRRDDDRYLMLEALLSAREKLYISWVGRNIRDQSEQAPSVLVSQLRDYLQAGWQIDLRQHTQEYPLQPFSRQYFFESDQRPLTYAREWGAAYEMTQSTEPDSALPETRLDADYRLRISELVKFMRQPVKYFFQKRLGVNFVEESISADNEEPFTVNSLDYYQFAERLLSADNNEGNEAANAEPQGFAEVEAALRHQIGSMAAEGVLPIGLTGRQWQERLVSDLAPVRWQWVQWCQEFPSVADKYPVSMECEGVLLSDWLDHLRTDGQQTLALTQTASKLSNAKGELQVDKLIDAWIHQVVAASMDFPVRSLLLGRDVMIDMPALEATSARTQLGTLIQLWLRAQNQLLPTACKTALAWLEDKDPRTAYEGNEQFSGELKSPYLARLWPEFSSLQEEEEWETISRQLYQPLLDWSRQLQVTPIPASGLSGEAS